MKITDIKLRQLTGTMETSGGPYMEDRLVQPTDIYEEFRSGGRRGGARTGEMIDDTHLKTTEIFAQIDTDEGISGISGTLMPNVAFQVWKMKDLLIGRDPGPTEFLWDIMHRSEAHGRQGEPMMGISALDIALWDIKGKALGQPVHQLIGGPTQKTMPAYASMLGYTSVDMGLVRERAIEMKERGYQGMKWFFRHGPMSGPEGVKLNHDLVRTVREAVGPDIDIMFDAWQSWDYNYAVKMIARIEEYEPRWLEEVGMADRIDTYRKVKESTTIPISGVEHEYTRWGFKPWMDAEAVDIIQPDVNWCGGLSEILKIAALATSYDLTTIAHQGVTPAGMAFSAAQSPIHTPYVEMLVKHAALAYHFLQAGPNFEDGKLTVSDDPGFGYVIDESKIESEVVMEF
jgi:L-rhamnonate dehydratase